MTIDSKGENVDVRNGTSTERPLLVVNPNAGGGKARRNFPELRPAIERALGSFDVVFTERGGHGIELARIGADEGRTLVVAVGGDGTMNEVANGVLTAKAPLRTAVGFIGQGTGGDFRRSLDIEHRLDRYLAAIASGNVRAIDVGRVRFRDPKGQPGERYFINILSAGMGGLVDRYMADASRMLGPSAAYFGASLRALVNIQRARVRAQVTDGGQTRDERIGTYMIAICNGCYFGSGMQIAPMAKLDDGRFEVVAIGAEGKLEIALRMQSVYSGAHMKRSDTVHFGCERLKLELENARDAESTFLVDCDGEPIGGMPIEIELLPKALNFRA